ncbi:MAG: AraC family transcriptional regulator [Sporolactobacillus sp.]|jgi:YesN/AraC family two-component response regulator|nr:AraC family transcriptional regulator [Sporolactobacillus sp.]
MYLVDTAYQACARFSSAGTFVNPGPWMHQERIIDSYEIMNPVRSTIFIECDSVPYAVKPNEILIIPPGVRHRGTRYSHKNIEFHWLHFYENRFRRQTEAETIDLVAHQKTDEMLILPIYTHKIDCERFHVMFNQLLDLSQEGVNPYYLNTFLSCLLFELTEETVKRLIHTKNERSDLQPVRDWIRIHSYDDLSLEQIARRFNYNKSYLSRIYKKNFGISISEQMVKFRLKRAKDLLSETDLNIVTIASQIGYDDSKYFMRIFKKREGITPSQYRKTFCQRHYNKV